MIQEVKYNGFSASSSDYDCPDGELAAVVNLIPEDGALRPIPAPKVVFSLKQGQKVVLQHETATYNHYIVQDASNNLYWRERNNNTLNSISGFSKAINHITAIGNTIVTLCDDGLYYMLWDNNTQKYKYLGNQIPECPISFGLQADPTHSGTFSITTNGSYSLTTNRKFTEGDKNAITAQVLAKVNKFIADESVGKNKFIYPFFVRYAYRLYDGTLTRHSAPILMLPCTNTNPIVAGNISGTSMTLDVFTLAASLDYRPLITQEQKTSLLSWGDIVKSIDIFISAPIYTYDQSGVCESLADHPTSEQNFYGKYNPVNVSENDKPKYQNYLIWPIHYRLSDEYSNYPGNACIALPTFTQSDLDSKIRDCGEFYLLTSIEIKDLPISSYERPLVPFEDGILSSLVGREVMTDDYQSNDVLIPSFAQTYNSRLNIANIERKLFAGYDLASMCCYLQSSEDGSAYRFATHTKVLSEQEIIVERVSSDTNTSYISGYVYMFYPDVAAKSITIYNSGYTGDIYKACNLVEHTRLNGAVYFEGLNPTGSWGEGYTKPTKTDKPYISVPNKIYTSEVNNPFLFPLLGINTIGTGEIVGISTAAKALSEGQFGQFPLYAFTTDGVWALEVSATGTYSAKQPITRDVCVDGKSITQIDNAVLFATARGIMLLSGSESICITDVIESDEIFQTANIPQGNKLLTFANLQANNADYIAFNEYIKDCRMAYDYINQRIFVINPNCYYAYVYSMESKAWGIVASDIVSILNTYPEAMAMDRNNNFVDLSATLQTSSIPCFFITRPLKMNAHDILKTIDAVIQRGQFSKGKVMSALYGSRDLKNWFLVYSSIDHYLRGFRGSAYKYFRVAVMASLDIEESISGCSIQYQTQRNNQLR